MKIEQAVEYFGRGIEQGRVAHSYVIVGNPRTDGTTFAEQVLAQLFCGALRKPCLACRECEQVRNHVHPDILWVEPQQKSRRISVEQVRDLQHLIFQTSFSGGWKACVVVAADRLGEQAANAFLRTLEEPPARSLFLLLTDRPQWLIPTIVSRSQRLVLASTPSELPPELRKEVLDILRVGDGESRVVAALIQSERMVHFLKDVKKQVEREVAAETEEMDSEGAGIDDETLDARTNARYREIRSAIMQSVLQWHRDILMVCTGVEDLVADSGEGLEAIRRAARGTAASRALRNVQVVTDMERQLESNIPEALVFGQGFGAIATGKG